MSHRKARLGRRRTILHLGEMNFFFNKLLIIGCLWPLTSGRPNVDANCVDGNQGGKGGPQENQGTVIRGKVER